MSIHEEVRALLGTYARALHDRDRDAAVQCFTAEASVMAPGIPTATGPALRDLYGQIVGSAVLDITFTVDLLIDGEQAVAFTHSDGSQTDVASGSSGAEANREAFVFTREGGELKISHYLFNTLA